MDPEIETRQTTAVEAAVQELYKITFPDGDHSYVPTIFAWATAAFTGNYQDYQPIDARYHDLEHTLQGTLCLARLLHGYHRAACKPQLSQRMFELAILAILFHDTGYLKKAADSDGTGAKYTLVHVSRSVTFAGCLLEEKGFSKAEIQTVQNMIRCTGVNVDLSTIPFQDDLERKLGFALGTSDLLGQMAAKDYIDKLPILYSEFAESALYNSRQATATGAFASARDLMEKTPLFWEKYVLPKLKKDFQSVYTCLNSPYPDGTNLYLERIEANIAKLREHLARTPGDAA